MVKGGVWEDMNRGSLMAGADGMVDPAEAGPVGMVGLGGDPTVQA